MDANLEEAPFADLVEKIEKIEERVRTKAEVPEEDLKLVYAYTKRLNLPVGTEEKELPFDFALIPEQWEDFEGNPAILIHDLNLEIARVLYVMGSAYEHKAEAREDEKAFQEAIQYYMQAARAFKTAALFSRVNLQAARNLGALNPVILDVKAENLRALGQSCAVLEAEEEGDWEMAARLSLGLSTINRRISYMLSPRSIKAVHTRGLAYFDQAMACKKFVQVERSRRRKGDPELYSRLAGYFLHKAIRYWADYRDQLQQHKSPKPYIQEGLELFADDVAVATEELESLTVDEDPEFDEEAFSVISPVIAVPENQFSFFPKALGGVTRLYETTVKKHRIRPPAQYKFTQLSVADLKREKFSLERTIVELRRLVNQGTISLDEFTEKTSQYMAELNDILAVLNRTRN